MNLSEAIVIASGHFLTSNLPDDWFRQPHATNIMFVEEHRAGIVACNPSSQVYRSIEIMAEALIEAYHRGKKDRLSQG